jgi:hypothetical protein
MENYERLTDEYHNIKRAEIITAVPSMIPKKASCHINWRP